MEQRPAETTSSDAPAPDPQAGAQPAAQTARGAGQSAGGGAGGGAGSGTALLFFGFGTAAGILLAFSGIGFLQDSAALIATVFLAALIVVLILGILLLALRRLIWQRLFGYADVQLETFATPMGQIAERAMQGDAPGASLAARDLVALALARYAWISTRRWLVAALTALIAAMAALAGTALLFKQNQLIAAQTGLLTEQNAKIEDQSLLLQQDLQLAEAARNAALAVEITNIAAALGAVAERVHQGNDAGALVNVTDPQRDLPRGLVLRITSISRALKPYRFLDTGLRAGDPSDAMRLAMQRRRGDMADSYAAMAERFAWEEPPDRPRLTDRPTSPERGQLLSVLVAGGVRNLEALTLAGLDLSSAEVRDADLGLLTLQQARLARADLSGSYLTEIDLRGARMENIRLRRSTLRAVRLGTLAPDQALPPLDTQGAEVRTALTGADLAGAVIFDSSFAGAWMLAANLDGAVLSGADFRGAELGAATLRGTVVLAADFTGAGLKGADWEGAILFGADALDRLATAAASGTFVPGAWRLEPVPPAEVLAIPQVNDTIEPGAITAAGPAFRLRRQSPP